MQEHSFLPEFSDDDVVEFEENNMTKVKVLRNAVIQMLNDDLEKHIKNHLVSRNITIPSAIGSKNNEKQDVIHKNIFLKQGVRCEVLNLGAKTWKKGRLKLRLSLEFEPDEPEAKKPSSPLDDIRQAINQ